MSGQGQLNYIYPIDFRYWWYSLDTDYVHSETGVDEIALEGV